jgi:predicted RNase H-like HicB family nuclease
MNRYEIIIYWSNEDNVFIAEVPELAGCVAHGNSYEKALSNAQEAIQLWIDTAKEFGDPISALMRCFKCIGAEYQKKK